jgi:hypothetical protein
MARRQIRYPVPSSCWHALALQGKLDEARELFEPALCSASSRVDAADWG